MPPGQCVHLELCACINVSPALYSDISGLSQDCYRCSRRWRQSAAILQNIDFEIETDASVRPSTITRSAWQHFLDDPVNTQFQRERDSTSGNVRRGNNSSMKSFSSDLRRAQTGALLMPELFEGSLETACVNHAQRRAIVAPVLPFSSTVSQRRGTTVRDRNGRACQQRRSAMRSVVLRVRRAMIAVCRIDA